MALRYAVAADFTSAGRRSNKTPTHYVKPWRQCPKRPSCRPHRRALASDAGRAAWQAPERSDPRPAHVRSRQPSGPGRDRKDRMHTFEIVTADGRELGPMALG